jgi:hypothetical protein
MWHGQGPARPAALDLVRCMTALSSSRREREYPLALAWLRADGDNRAVTGQPDVLLFAALERWWDTNRSALATQGMTGTLQGPFDALGMDPVYILRMDSERRETEVS